MNARALVLALALGVALELVLAAATATASSETAPFVTLGFVDQSSAVLRVQTGAAHERVTMDVLDGETGKQAVESAIACLTEAVELNGGACTMRVSGLRADRRYRVQVLAPSRPDWSWAGEFRTGADGRARLAFGSCAHQLGATHAVFRAIASEQPDVLLSLGDLIYVDLADAAMPTGDPAHRRMVETGAFTRKFFLDKYARALGASELRRLAASTPLIGMIDDHELADNYDTSHPAALAAAAMSAFGATVGALGPPRERDTLWFSVRIGPLDVFVLDVRSYRSPYTAQDSAEKTMLGAAQLAALVDWLARSRAPFRAIASPVMFNDCGASAPDPTGAPLLDAWWRYRTERAVIFDAIARAPGGPTVLLSADSHWPAVTRITGARDDGVPWELFEISASPLDAFALPTATERDVTVGNVRSKLLFAHGPQRWAQSADELEIASFFGLVDVTDEVLEFSIRQVRNGVASTPFTHRIVAAAESAREL